MIKHYTVNFYGIGKVNKNQMQSVYLRYLYTLEGRKHTLNFETGYQLTKEQITLLKANQLGGQIQENLVKQKSRLIQVIETLNLRDNSYPSQSALKEYFDKTVNVLSIDNYLNKFLHTLSCKQSSKSIYEINLLRFVRFVQMNNKTIQGVVNKEFISQYFHSFHHKDGKPVKKSNSTQKNATAIVVRFVNYIAKETNLRPVEYENKVKELSNKLHLTDEQLNAMLTIDIESKELRRDNKKNLVDCRNLTKINSVIGLRINELLSVRRDMITFNDGYVRIEFVDEKNNQVRAVVVKDKEVIVIIKSYCNTDHPFKVMDYKLYDSNIKQLAKLAGLTQDVTLYSLKANSGVHNTKPLWKHVSSHSIRRYAIQKNLVTYGIVVAKQFSGHRSFEMIQRHYSRNLTEQELLDALKRDMP